MKTWTCLLAMLASSLLALDVTPYRKIVCLGDSITHGGNYHQWLQLNLAQKDPQTPRQVINRGISGYQSAQLHRNALKIIREEKPDLAFMMIGINDILGCHFSAHDRSLDKARSHHPELDRFEQHIRQTIKLFQQHSIPVIMLTTPPYNDFDDPVMKTPVRHFMDTCGVTNLNRIIMRIGKDMKVNVIDITTPLRKQLARQPQDFPRGQRDRVHPGPSEHRIIAETIVGHPIAIQNPKLQTYTQAMRQAMAGMQRLRLIESRIPDQCQTEEEKIEWYATWVQTIKDPNARKHHSQDLTILKNRHACYQTYRASYDKAFRQLYATKD